MIGFLQLASSSVPMTRAHTQADYRRFPMGSCAVWFAGNDLLLGQKTARHFVALEETHTFNPQLINTVRGGFNRSVALAGYGASAINPAAADRALSATPGEDPP